MKTTKRVVYVLCGVLALCLLFLNSTPVQASEYGTYGYSIFDEDMRYHWQEFNEDTSMLESINIVTSSFYSIIRDNINSNFQWYGFDSYLLHPITSFFPSRVSLYLENINLSDPSVLVNVLVYSSNANWRNAQPVLYLTKNNNSLYSYDTDTHEFVSKPFLALPDVVNYSTSSPYFYMFDGDLWLNTDNTNIEAMTYVRGFEDGVSSSYVNNEDDFNTVFNSWLADDTRESLLIMPYYRSWDNGWNYYLLWDCLPTQGGFIVPVVVQSRIYKISSLYGVNEHYIPNHGTETYYTVYAKTLEALNETPFTYYAEPFSTYISAPWVTPTPIAPQPTRPIVLPTFQPFATPTPITGVIVPTYNTDDDAGSVIGYALGNVTSEFIKPVYSMVVSVINYMFYNNIWFSFLVVAPSIAFIVFIIGRLRKK